MNECETIEELFQQLRKLTLAHRLSRRNVAKLVLDIYLVSAGIRTACLIDQFTPTPATCEGIANAARSAEIAENLMFVFVQSAQQVLVVNRTLLLSNKKHMLHRRFVDISESPPRYRDSIPANAQTIISCIQEAALQTSDVVYLISETHSAVRRSMIPVVGYLLDYPSIYCLGDEQNDMNIFYESMPNTEIGDDDWDPIVTSLVDIHLYQIELWSSLPEELSSVLHSTKHSILSFSLPCILPDAYQTALQHAKNLEAMFDLRISTSGVWSKFPISSSVSEVSLDRVAL